jgi:predicted MFS family arabinose efflux permease
MIAALIAGRVDSRGREWDLLVVPMGGIAAADLLLLAGADAATMLAGVALVAGALAINGILNGPMDIGLFTIRQRRTDPEWLGRAFAVSMGFNFLGYPIGTALAGALVSTASIEVAVVVGALAAVLGGVTAAVLIPRRAANARRLPTTPGGAGQPARPEP